MPTIRIEDDVFQGLQKLAAPFVDTPNSVIRRLLTERDALLNLDDSSPVIAVAHDPHKASQKAPLPSTKALTPQSTYEMFLLFVLGTKFSGRASKQEATEEVISTMKSMGFLTEADFVSVTTGETKAENTIAWGRNALKTRGLISKLSEHGIWELTPEGMTAAQLVELPKSSS